MAISIRQIPDMVVYGIALAWNTWRGGATQVGALFHADATSTTSGDATTPATAAVTVTAANATDLPTCLALANQIQAVLQIHWRDGISTNKYAAGAHKVPDTTNNTVRPDAVDLPTAVALANFMKAQLNAHFVQATVHYNNDATNTIATANATILSDTITLLNAIKTAVNAHMGSAPVASSMVNILPT
jgi:hypothetical protein